MITIATLSPRAFITRDERLLTILADHAAIAFENARLYQQLSDTIEEIRRTQAKLLQTEKLATMSQLLAGVAHELNSPLSVVLGQTALFRQTLDNESQIERADKIIKAAERCAEIVHSFRVLVRQHPIERKWVSLNSIVQEAYDLFAYKLRCDNVNVTLVLAMDLPPLWADPHQLHQVVVSLIENAYQAVHEAPEPRQLRLSTKFDTDERMISLEVSDTGPGIPREIQSRIFEPFFTTKPEGQAAGLGLSLCARIIESHRGTIRVESQPGQGALFRIELPLENPAQIASDSSPGENPHPPKTDFPRGG
jgi:signal transduction histidine kinase